jgi:hypothetical protein
MKYIKRPIVIEAIQWTGKNLREIVFKFPNCFANNLVHHPEELLIDTLEGSMVASKGDYIIRGIKGEYYPCKPDIFEASYEMVNE